MIEISASDQRVTDELLCMLGTLMNDDASREQMLELANGMMNGHLRGVTMVACCYVLHCAVADADPEIRAILVSAFMRLIDPTQGDA